MLAYVNYEFTSYRHSRLLYRSELCCHILIMSLVVNDIEVYCIELNYVGIC